MACSCHDSCTPPTADTGIDPRWGRTLWIALWVNLAFFVIELGAGLASGSVSLLADAVDFAGDAANYGLSLAVLSMALVWRSRAAFFKGATMFAYGLFVLAKAGWAFWHGGVPDATTMGVVGLMALLANAGVAVMLYAWRNGDANMRSVWLCSRNDAISNLAVVAAAVGVFGTNSAWPDLAVAAIMAGLAISAGWSVMRLAKAEMLAQSTTQLAGHGLQTPADGTSYHHNHETLACVDHSVAGLAAAAAQHAGRHHDDGAHPHANHLGGERKRARRCAVSAPCHSERRRRINAQ